jgi:NAD(P)H dehydrogenase (quinone)
LAWGSIIGARSPTSAKELSQYETAGILSEVLERKITYVPIEIEAFKGIMKSIGYTPHFIQHVSAVAQDCRDGVFSGENDLVKKLTGQKPLRLVDYITQHKAAFSLAT